MLSGSIEIYLNFIHCHFLKENEHHRKHNIGEYEVLAAWRLFHTLMEGNSRQTFSALSEPRSSKAETKPDFGWR